MRKLFLLALLLAVLICHNPTSAAVTTVIPEYKPEIANSFKPAITPAEEYISRLKIKDVQKLLGRKLKLKEKIALKFYQWKLKKKKEIDGDKAEDKGTTSMILGISGLASLFIPYAGIAAIPLAILAIIFGNQAKKLDPKNKKAKTGVILGWITLGLIVIAVAIVIAILASWGF